MFERIALVVSCLLVLSCAELTSDSNGPGGSTGTGGTAGTGPGGSGGTGGSAGVDPCAIVVPEPADTGTESESYGVETDGLVSASVCSGSCSTVDDIDRWSITTCGGNYKICLSWSTNFDDNLNLALYDSSDQLVEEATPSTCAMGDRAEEITATLAEDEPYVVEVTAVNTSGNERYYNLLVSPID